MPAPSAHQNAKFAPPALFVQVAQLDIGSALLLALFALPLVPPVTLLDLTVSPVLQAISSMETPVILATSSPTASAAFLQQAASAVFQVSIPLLAIVLLVLLDAKVVMIRIVSAATWVITSLPPPRALPAKETAQLALLPPTARAATSATTSILLFPPISARAVPQPILSACLATTLTATHVQTVTTSTQDHVRLVLRVWGTALSVRLLFLALFVRTATSLPRSLLV